VHRLFADWYKQADLHPTAEVLKVRWSGVETCLKKLDRNMVLQLTRVSFGLPKPEGAISETDGLANAFKESDVSFPMKDNDNLLRVLAGATLAECIESKRNHASFAALCVVSAACYGVRPTPSVEELPAIAHQYLKAEGQHQRETGHSEAAGHPKFSKIEVPNPAPIQISDTGANNWGQLNQNFQNLKAWVDSTSTAIQALSAGLTDTRTQTSAAFGANAERDTLDARIKVLREECDVLWWLFGEFSERFNLSWKERRANEMCLLVGEELAELYAYYLPAPNTEAFLSKALSVMQPQEGKLRIQTVITNAPLEWVRHVSDRTKSAVSRTGAATPLHFTLFSRPDGGAVPGDQGQLKSDAEFTTGECAYQMLIETLLLELLEAKNA
jgi:hypothetical protein